MLPVLPYQECELAQWKTDKQLVLPLLKLTLRRLCHSSIDFISLLCVGPTQVWPNTERENEKQTKQLEIPLLKLTLRRLCLSSIDFIYLLNVAPTQIWPHTERERQTVDDSASKANVAASLSLQLTLSVFSQISPLCWHIWYITLTLSVFSQISAPYLLRSDVCWPVSNMFVVLSQI